MHRLRHKIKAEGRRLLRVLLLWLSAVPANSGSPLRRTGCRLLLFVTAMSTAPALSSRDWLRNLHSSVLAWWLPHAAILAGLLVPVTVRMVIWIIALIWMGAACILNARRCNRTHCRYTGPYYLLMIAPVLVLGIVSAEVYGWMLLGAIALGGSGLLWWATERAWGKFS
jgi:hypothetical protein